MTSINNECFLKKSAPRIGLSTLATLNEWRAEKLGRSKRMDFLPKVSMKVPFAALSLCPCLGGRALIDLLADKKDVGNTDMSAPLSIKKEHFEVASHTDMDPAESVTRETMPGVNDARRWSFPGPWMCCRVWR